MDNFETQRLAQEIADSHTKLELAKTVIELQNILILKQEDALNFLKSLDEDKESNSRFIKAAQMYNNLIDKGESK
ncbi:hypothetical protein NVP1101O_017 [Vibrio phage 1.101.O._10N.261.45.C6]|nr:hypothetical protein NVP1101O_017 [Vibrio phage 1.101.O._10N.261.45.C6]